MAQGLLWLLSHALSCLVVSAAARAVCLLGSLEWKGTRNKCVSLRWLTLAHRALPRADDNAQ